MATTKKTTVKKKKPKTRTISTTPFVVNGRKIQYDKTVFGYYIYYEDGSKGLLFTKADAIKNAKTKPKKEKRKFLGLFNW